MMNNVIEILDDDDDYDKSNNVQQSSHTENLVYLISSEDQQNVTGTPIPEIGHDSNSDRPSANLPVGINSINLSSIEEFDTTKEQQDEIGVHPSSPPPPLVNSQVEVIKSSSQPFNRSQEVDVPFTEDSAVYNEFVMETSDGPVTVLETATQAESKRGKYLDEIFDSASDLSELLAENFSDNNPHCTPNPRQTFSLKSAASKWIVASQSALTQVPQSSQLEALATNLTDNKSVSSIDVLKEFPSSPTSLVTHDKDESKVSKNNNKELYTNRGAAIENIVSESSKLLYDKKKSDVKKRKINLDTFPTINLTIDSNKTSNDKINNDCGPTLTLLDENDFNNIEESSVTNISIDGPTNSTQEEAPADNGSEFKSILESYITNGKYLSKQESDEMIQFHINNNNALFKQANNVLRDNVKAREEIIVKIAGSLAEIFKPNMDNLKTILQPAKIEVEDNENVPIIRFFRNCNSLYDYNNDIYFPIKNKLVEESTVVIYINATEFFIKYQNSRKQLQEVIMKLKKEKKFIILVLSHVSKLKRDLETIENKKFRDKVNSQLHGQSKNNNSKSLSSKLEEVKKTGLKANNLREVLRNINIGWKIRVFTVNSDLEFLGYLPNLVSLVGKQRKDTTIRFMKYAHMKVKSGQNKTDILKKTLQEVGKVPELKANSMTSIYPNFQTILTDFSDNKLKAGDDGRYLLSESLEKKIYKLFMCKDPNATLND